MKKKLLARFSEDLEYIQIKGYGLYKRCEIQPEMAGTQIPIPKVCISVEPAPEPKSNPGATPRKGE